MADETFHSSRLMHRAFTIMSRHRLVLPGLLLLGVAMPPLIIVGCLRDDGGTSPAVRESRAGGASAVPVVETNQRLDRTIRVRLNGLQGSTTFKVAVDHGFVVHDDSTGQVIEDSAQASPAVVVSTALESPTGIKWGEAVYMTNALRLTPTQDGSLVVNNTRYRGGLMVRRDGQRLFVNNTLDIESYLRGVLIGELPRTFHPEAFAALAVAARTYVLYQKLKYGGTRGYDVLPDECSQMYIGVAGEKSIAVSAVERTHGQVCFLPEAEGNSIFCTYYSSTCGGMSQNVANVKPADPAVSPLAGGVACVSCTGSKFYAWPEVRLSRVEVTKRLKARYPEYASLGVISNVEAEKVNADGRIIRVRVTGKTGKSVSMVGEDFRLAVGGRTLKSTWCKPRVDGDSIVFSEGRGFGHGMGLCQYGADGMARGGADYRQIIAFYYPGSVVKELR